MQAKAGNALLLVIDIQERLMPAIWENDKVTDKTVGLIEGCKCLEVPMVLTEQYKKGLGLTTEPIRKALGLEEGFEKRTFSCWDEEGFPALMGEKGRTDILVAGVETHVCVQKTVLDLLENGYRVFVIADCVSSRKEEDKRYAIERMRQAGAVITTMESALFELCVDSRHPMFKQISAIVK